MPGIFGRTVPGRGFTWRFGLRVTFTGAWGDGEEILDAARKEKGGWVELT